MRNTTDNNWRSYLLRQRRRRRNKFEEPPKPIVYKRDFVMEVMPTVVSILMLVPVLGALAMIIFMFG